MTNTLYNIILIVVLFTGIRIHAQDNELFSWETGKVNNKIPMTVSLKEFEKMYKKADSITVPLPSQVCGNEENVKMVYYKGARYELDNGIMNFRELDFSARKNMYFQQKDDWFDHTTSLKSFSKTYPVAATQIETEDDPETGEIFDVIGLLPLEKDADCLWMFYFKKERLVKIKCEFSCN